MMGGKKVYKNIKSDMFRLQNRAFGLLRCSPGAFFQPGPHEHSGFTRRGHIWRKNEVNVEKRSFHQKLTFFGSPDGHPELFPDLVGVFSTSPGIQNADFG